MALPPIQTGISNEEWRNISEFPNYQVSNIGRVRESITGQVKNLFTNVRGYIYVAFRKNNRQCNLYVHRLVATAFLENPMNKPCIDHANRLKSDNTINNLRWCTRSENQANRGKQRNTSSQFIGVCWDKRRKQWKAAVKFNGRTINLGRFSDERDAARAYDAKALELFGEFANINGIAPDDESNTDSQDNDTPELSTPTSDYEEFTAESGEVEEDVD